MYAWACFVTVNQICDRVTIRYALQVSIFPNEPMPTVSIKKFLDVRDIFDFFSKDFPSHGIASACCNWNNKSPEEFSAM